MAKKSLALAPANTLRSLPASAGTALFADPLAAPAIDTFAKVLGGRADLAAELLTSPDLTAPIRKVLLLILDPRFDRHSLSKLCDEAGLTPGEFFAAFRDATLAKANITAIRKVAERLVAITECVLDGAVNQLIVCEECNGSTQQLYPPARKGQDPTIGKCLRCNGHGEVPVRADFEKQKIALELGGLLKKGPAVQLNQLHQSLHLTQSGSGSNLAQLQQAAAAVMFGRDQPPLDLPPDPPPVTEIVEAEVVNAE